MQEKDQVTNTKKQPIAIIGMACRFPGGVNTPEDLFKLIVDKRDAIVEIPEDRWQHKKFFHADERKPGKTYAQHGGFLQADVYEFDPLFFGIAPREAEVMDPQQRYLLQVSYEALENAGLRLEDLNESKVGVFIGGFTLEYQSLIAGHRIRLPLGEYHRLGQVLYAL